MCQHPVSASHSQFPTVPRWPLGMTQSPECDRKTSGLRNVLTPYTGQALLQ